jgi:CBS domain-containing protein
VTVPQHATIQQAAQTMEQYKVGCLLVVDGDTLAGIVTDRDLVVRALAPAMNPDTPVRELISAPVTTLDAADDVGTAYDTFRRSGARRLPVLEGHKPVGILSVDDLFLDVLQRFADLLGPLSWTVLREPPAPAGPHPHPVSIPVAP